MLTKTYISATLLACVWLTCEGFYAGEARLRENHHYRPRLASNRRESMSLRRHRPVLSTSETVNPTTNQRATNLPANTRPRQTVLRANIARPAAQLTQSRSRYRRIRPNPYSKQVRQAPKSAQSYLRPRYEQSRSYSQLSKPRKPSQLSPMYRRIQSSMTDRTVRHLNSVQTKPNFNIVPDSRYSDVRNSRFASLPDGRGLRSNPTIKTVYREIVRTPQTMPQNTIIIIKEGNSAPKTAQNDPVSPSMSPSTNNNLLPAMVTDVTANQPTITNQVGIDNQIPVLLQEGSYTTGTVNVPDLAVNPEMMLDAASYQAQEMVPDLMYNPSPDFLPTATNSPSSALPIEPANGQDPNVIVEAVPAIAHSQESVFVPETLNQTPDVSIKGPNQSQITADAISQTKTEVLNSNQSTLSTPNIHYAEVPVAIQSKTNNPISIEAPASINVTAQTNTTSGTNQTAANSPKGKKADGGLDTVFDAYLAELELPPAILAAIKTGKSNAPADAANANGAQGRSPLDRFLAMTMAEHMDLPPGMVFA